MADLIAQFKIALRVGAPFIACRTLDPEALILRLQRAATNNHAVVGWECINGLKGLNTAGRDALNAALGGDPVENSVNCTAALEVAYRLPENTILFMTNAHRYVDKADVAQALANLRTPYKCSGRAAVLLGPDFTLPAELQHDVLLLDDPLPTEEELRAIVTDVVGAKQASMRESKKPEELIIKVTDEEVDRAVDALRGLPPFPAEQTVALAIDGRRALDVDDLWERKRQQLSGYKGLTVWRGGERFDDLGGLDAIKRKFRRIINGRNPPRVVVWVEESEKQGGLSKQAGGDLSHTSSDQLAVLLQEIVDHDYTGAILDGVPGSGKSAFAKAFGNEAGVLTIRLDLGGSKGEGLVGQAENEIRRNLKVIEAIAGPGGAFFLLTSNNSRALDSALKSRMTKGVWFFDVPDEAERMAIWDIYLAKYPEVNGLQIKPDYSNWTGREIRACVMTAWEERITLQEAARDIIPVAVADSEEVARMRREAAGRYNSAAYEGAYHAPAETTSYVAVGAPQRRFAVED